MRTVIVLAAMALCAACVTTRGPVRDPAPPGNAFIADLTALRADARAAGDTLALQHAWATVLSRAAAPPPDLSPALRDTACGRAREAYGVLRELPPPYFLRPPIPYHVDDVLVWPPEPAWEGASRALGCP